MEHALMIVLDILISTSIFVLLILAIEGYEIVDD